MAGFSKLSINRKEENRNEVLSREMMKQIKGGGSCYLYCGGYNQTTMYIVSSCDKIPGQLPACYHDQLPYCTCH